MNQTFYIVYKSAAMYRDLPEFINRLMAASPEQTIIYVSSQGLFDSRQYLINAIDTPMSANLPQDTPHCYRGDNSLPWIFSWFDIG